MNPRPAGRDAGVVPSRLVSSSCAVSIVEFCVFQEPASGPRMHRVLLMTVAVLCAVALATYMPARSSRR
jgi:hypothetical protein